jgi:hypothetical protein
MTVSTCLDTVFDLPELTLQNEYILLSYILRGKQSLVSTSQMPHHHRHLILD